MELAFAHPGQTVAVEVRVRHCDGSWRVLEKVGKVREDGLLVTNNRDITARRQKEDELRRLNAELEDRVEARTAELQAALAESRRLAAIIEATTDLVATADMAGRVTYLNSAGRRLVGLGEEDALDNFTFADAYPPEEFRRITEEVIPAARGRLGRRGA